MSNTDHMQDTHTHYDCWDVWAADVDETAGTYREVNRCQVCGSVFSYPKPLPLPDGLPTDPPGGG